MQEGTRTGVVFASFGTTYDATRASCIDAVVADVAAAFPGAASCQAYTSSVVRRVLAGRGVEVPDVRGALGLLADEGVRDAVVQPGHLMPGREYDKLCRQAQACRGLFDRLRVGAPLLSGSEDVDALLRAVAARHPARPGRAVVLMGHGTDHFANVVYEALGFHAQVIGRPDVFVGTVEGYPTLDVIMRLMEGRGFSHVLLAPLMLVAGDHAENDMAGEGQDSWASRLRAAGYEVACDLHGLGELPAVRRMYVDHALAAR